jgi:phage-related protein
MADVPDKPLVWLKGEVKTPPFGNQARLEAGLLLRRLQQGQGLSLPHSRPMPAIGRRCHELRIGDHDQTWRIVYHVAPDAVVILAVFSKKTEATPVQIIEVCRKRLAAYLQAISDKEYT